MTDNTITARKRRRMSLHFDDPIDKAAEALYAGRRVMALEPLDAVAVVGTGFDSLVDHGRGRKDLVRFRQAGYRAALVKALYKYVDLHARTADTLLDMDRHDAPGRPQRPAPRKPEGPEWMWRGTPLETAQELPYQWNPVDGFDPVVTDQDEHWTALNELFTAWCGWLRTYSHLHALVTADESLAQSHVAATTKSTPAAKMLDLHCQLAEMYLTRQMMELALCAMGVTLLGTGATSMARIALLWLGQCQDAQDESTQAIASPAASCLAATARRGTFK